MRPRVEVRTALRPTRLVVDLAAIRDNVARVAEITGTRVCAVVKGDGYGHGIEPVARAALQGGADWLAVALVEEGLELRQAGVQAPILVLAEPPVGAIPYLLEANLTPTVYRPAFIGALDAAASSQDRIVTVHLKADTGMARVGVPETDWESVLDRVAAAPGLRVDGLQTHLACADDPPDPTTARQMVRLDRFVALARERGLAPTYVHAANTAGALAHPDARRDLVRTGIGIYGLSPDVGVVAADYGLEPAHRLVSEVGYVKRVAADTPVSYGHRWSAPRDGWLATVPIGYADGVPRALSNRAEVLIRGRRRVIAGRICMDQLMAWCDDEEPRVGEEVVLLGSQGGDRIRAEEWAAVADTITYEILTQVTARVPRHHVWPGH